jgi:hypothetical protein
LNTGPALCAPVPLAMAARFDTEYREIYLQLPA